MLHLLTTHSLLVSMSLALLPLLLRWIDPYTARRATAFPKLCSLVSPSSGQPPGASLSLLLMFIATSLLPFSVSISSKAFRMLRKLRALNTVDCFAVSEENGVEDYDSRRWWVEKVWV